MRSAFTFFGLLGAVWLALPLPASAQQQRPVVTDSRIKTLVYNENDVYSLLTHYGYQANIEFGPKERIETVSVGDRVGWQIIPAGRRLFVRPLEEGAHTNMTVITTLRTYQFDLKASIGGDIKPNEELVYVVRFYYPEDDLSHMAPSYTSQVPVSPPAAAAMPVQPAFNYRYTFTGPDKLAPQKIYDDGQSTYFLLSAAPTSASVVGQDGKETPVTLETLSDGTRRAVAVGARFLLRYGPDTVSVYNEAY